MEKVERFKCESCGMELFINSDKSYRRCSNQTAFSICLIFWALVLLSHLVPSLLLCITKSRPPFYTTTSSHNMPQKKYA